MTIFLYSYAIALVLFAALDIIWLSIMGPAATLWSDTDSLWQHAWASAPSIRICGARGGSVKPGWSGWRRR